MKLVRRATSPEAVVFSFAESFAPPACIHQIDCLLLFFLLSQFLLFLFRFFIPSLFLLFIDARRRVARFFSVFILLSESPKNVDSRVLPLGRNFLVYSCVFLKKKEKKSSYRSNHCSKSSSRQRFYTDLLNQYFKPMKNN